MESLYAVYDGEKIVTEKKFNFTKGQKIILTILENEISQENETPASYVTAVKSGTFNYLFEEGEQEYNIDDCKIKFK